MSNERKEFLQDDGQLRVFIVPVDILDVPDLTSSEKLVYIVLRSYSYVNPSDSSAFPDYETIARKASLSRKRVIDVVKS
ncbi:helix-turn-helix domain-containing protein, partial [Paenibacillus alvei]